MPPELPDTRSPSPISNPDRIRLLHMREAVRHALDFAQGRTRSDLGENAMFRRAILHCIQEIGEAAAQVTPAGRAGFLSIPWAQIVGMRHRLVHVYFDVNLI